MSRCEVKARPRLSCLFSRPVGRWIPKVEGGSGGSPPEKFCYSILSFPPFSSPFSSPCGGGGEVGIPRFWVCEWLERWCSGVYGRVSRVSPWVSRGCPVGVPLVFPRGYLNPGGTQEGEYRVYWMYYHHTPHHTSPSPHHLRPLGWFFSWRSPVRRRFISLKSLSGP